MKELIVVKSGCYAVLALGILLSPASLAQAEEISYDRDVRPILSAKCFKCHGFDPGTRKSRLRLDTFEGATHGANGYAAVAPGRPQDSDLLARVTATDDDDDDDDDDRMPPKGEPLTKAQVETLKQWIAQGARYATHWSYAPVAKPAVPKLKTQWPRNPIDNFIFARLQAEGRTPAPVAEPAVLLRRVYLDLIGLPPTVEDVLAFESAPTPGNLFLANTEIALCLNR